MHVGNSTSKELRRQLSLKYVSLLSLNLKQNDKKGKPSTLIDLQKCFLYFLIMGYM